MSISLNLRAIEHTAREARYLLHQDVPNDVLDRLSFIYEKASECIDQFTSSKPEPSELPRPPGGG